MTGWLIGALCFVLLVAICAIVTRLPERFMDALLKAVTR